MSVGTPCAGVAPSRAEGLSVAELVRVRSVHAGDDVYLESAGDAPGVSYGELGRAVASWAGRFEQLGVAPGATVGLGLSDPVELAVVFLAVLATGRCVAPFDHSATDAELVALRRRTTPRIVISDRRAPRGDEGGWLTMQPGACRSPFPPPSAGTPSAGTGGVVLSTSGTTGVPKVIRLDEAQLLHTASAVAGHLDLAPSDRGFNALPLFHINAEVVGLLATLVSGATIVLDGRFHRLGFWAEMARHRVTWINAVPAILARLAVLEEGERVPAGIRFARSASAPLAVPVLERFERSTGIPVVETYGMTEAASQITANPLHGPRKPGSVGPPVAAEVRVVTGDRAPARHGEIGSVEIRGPGVIGAYVSSGYDARVDAEGWLETGDLGHLDDDGYLFLAGRADDVINRGGEKIYPREVEEVLLLDPDVLSAAVVGQDDDVLGRVPVAYLVAAGVHEGGDETLAAGLVARLCDRCTRLLSRPKRPVVYHFVDRLTEAPTGKVRRDALEAGRVLFSLPVR